MASFSILLALLSTLCPTEAYDLKTKYDASNFFEPSSFNFYEGYDSFTHGLATYVSSDEATRLGLAQNSTGKVHLGVDSSTVLSSPSPGPDNGRKSIRLEGIDIINNGLVILDLDHLPAGACGQWPAIWLLRNDHDQGNAYSEIDIIEGISLQDHNEFTFWTDPKPCNMQDMGGTGKMRTLDCARTGNTHGCGVDAPVGTFGNAFNDEGGGVWATQIEADGIKAWHFSRKDVPADSLGDKPDPSSWGTPVLNFAAGTCDMSTAFQRMKIIINISFCGAYASGDSWSGYTNCMRTTGFETCNAYVAAKPGDFRDVYFLINSIKVFKKSGNVAPSASSTLRPERSSTSESTSPSTPSFCQVVTARGSLFVATEPKDLITIYTTVVERVTVTSAITVTRRQEPSPQSS